MISKRYLVLFFTAPWEGEAPLSPDPLLRFIMLRSSKNYFLELQFNVNGDRPRELFKDDLLRGREPLCGKLLFAFVNSSSCSKA